MTATFRFAPSPTGRLHIGNIRTATINWLMARQVRGRVILRLDDTDAARSTAEFAQCIRDDLDWMGFERDREVRQSERAKLYRAAAEKLKQAGRLYPCWETPEELELKRKRQLARGLPPVYDRSALSLTADDRARLEVERGAPHWRFLLERREARWDDLIRGIQTIDAGSLSDPVLLRADGAWLYTLPSVADDIDLGVTHVVRGEDHVANTSPQLQIFEAFGAEPPRFGHHTLLVSADGSALSKRSGALSVSAFRAEGIEPMAVASLAGTIGTSGPVTAYPDLDELAQHFDAGKLSRAPARFGVEELRGLNARLLQSLPYAAVAERLEAQGVTGGEQFWEAVQGNLAVLDDAVGWWKIVSGNIDRTIHDQALVIEAARQLPPEPWDDRTWGEWTKSLGASTGRKGGALFKPLRLALTGRDSGPEMRVLLPMIGRTRALRRLGAGS